MRTTVIVVSAAALIAAAPAVFARNVSSKMQQHRVFKTRHQVTFGYAPRHAVHAKTLKPGYPGALGYAPSEPKDYTIEQGRQAGGGGGM